MADPRVERLADVLVGYSTGVRKGDLVLISSTPLAAPLVRAVYARVLAAGGHPHVRIALEDVGEALLSRGDDGQVEWVDPASAVQYDHADVRIALEADSNTRHLTGVDPARQALYSRARQPILDRMLARAAAGDLRWVVTAFPTNAAAQDAEMSLGEYEDFVYGAGRLDRDDPVEEWRAFGHRLRRLASWLDTKRTVRVVADGTDLTVATDGRRWISSEGKENFPDGEVFTGPVETSVEGAVHFTYPAVFKGRAVEDVRLEFRRGEVVRASAGRGEEFLREMLALDEGARRAGEFAFGMNDAIREFTRNTLFDEKIGGTVHLALGKSYPETGGENESALHWDMVCDLRAGSEVYADGELVYRDGQFLDGLAS